jgi:hypothetical protein
VQSKDRKHKKDSKSKKKHHSSKKSKKSHKDDRKGKSKDKDKSKGKDDKKKAVDQQKYGAHGIIRASDFHVKAQVSAGDPCFPTLAS